MKKTFSTIIVFILVGNLLSPINAKTIDELQKEQQELRNKSQITRNALNNTTTEKNNVFNEISILDNNIVEVGNEIDRLENELNQTNQMLEQTQSDLKQAQEDKDKQYETLKKRIKYMYENGNVGYLEVLLNFKDFSDLLTRVENINNIITHDNEILDKLKQLEITIQTKVKEISEQKMTIELLSKQQQDKKHALEETMEQKNQIFMKLASDEEEYKRQIEQMEKDDIEIQELIRKAQEEAARKAREEAERKAREEAARKAAQEAAAKKAAQEAAAKKAQQQTTSKSNTTSSSSSTNKSNTSTKTSSTTYSGGRMSWPLPGYDAPNGDYGFGYRKSPITGRGETHRGIDIPAPRGTTVYAAAGGTVITASYLNSYGNAVIIDHGGGLSTVYAHNSKLLVSVGDTVSKGQAISQVGSTGDATGNHLHFEVRVNGQYTNPLPYVK